MIGWTEEQIKEARRDFRVFLFMVWRTIGLPAPTPIQYDIANTLQNPSSDRLIIEGFRGVAKSFITCSFAAWRLWRDPQTKVLIISASKDRADANAIFVKRIIKTMPFLEHLIPCPDKGNRDTQNLFDVAPAVPDISPSVKSVGITGQITGSRADLLISDDVEVPKNSATQQQREKLAEAVKEYDSIIKPKGQIIYLGTPQCEMSLYNELQKRGYDCIIYPVTYPTDQKIRDEYGSRLAPFVAQPYDDNPEAYKGAPTDPTRFDEKEINKRRVSYGKAGFSLQFLLNTSLSDFEKFPLKVSDLIVTDLDMTETSLKWGWATSPNLILQDVPCIALKNDRYYAPFFRSPETAPYTGTVMAIDPSGRGKDETAFAVVKYLNGYLFLMEVGGYPNGYTDATLTLLANKAKFWGVNEIVVEANFGDGMFTQLFKPILNKVHVCSVEETRSNSQKEARIIDTLEPVLMRHKLIVNTAVLLDDYRVSQERPSYSLIYQLTRLSRDRGSLAHDDRLDALAMAVAHWIKVLDRDADAGLEELSEEELEAWADPDKSFWLREPPLPPGLTLPKRVKTAQSFEGYSMLRLS